VTDLGALIAAGAAGKTVIWVPLLLFGTGTKYLFEEDIVYILQIFFNFFRQQQSINSSWLSLNPQFNFYSATSTCRPTYKT